jgi:hypothetical protein
MIAQDHSEVEALDLQITEFIEAMREWMVL